MASAETRHPHIDMPSTAFTTRVLSLVRRIPPGRVATYGDIAAAAGHPRAARAVGNIMRGCRAPGVPCHRVIAAAGRIGGYGGYTGLKRELLRAEGVELRGTTVRDFDARRFRFRPAPTSRRRPATEPRKPSHPKLR
jgi:methylated-DNA-protein-cysteine methyltransferase related protein